MSLRLSSLPGVLAVCRLNPGDPLPAWLDLSRDFVSVTRTGEELSIVCAASVVPADVTAERDWRAIMVEGPLDFALTGIMARLTAPLAAAGISIFALSTYDTDYLLVRENMFSRALEVLAETAEIVD